MKKILYLLYCSVIISLAACGGEQTASISSGPPDGGGSIAISAQTILAQAAKGNYREGELLVKFKQDIEKISSEKVHIAVGSSVVKKYSTVPNLELVHLPKGMSVTEAIRSYMSDPNVEFAEPNYVIRAAAFPNDQYFRNQWSLHNDGTYAGGTDDADIDAPEAWDIATGNLDVVIAVLDTGIAYTHDDLVNNIWKNPGESSCTDGYDEDANGFIDDCYGWNFVGEDNNPMDDDGHGTHVAGIIGAAGNNGKGIAGLMWQANLLPVKVLDSQGEGSNAELVDAINYIIALKQGGANIRVINASLGGGQYSKAVEDAIWTLNAEGILFVAAAGNGGDDGAGDNNDIVPFYPASYAPFNIISVAATDQDDGRVPFSNFGVNTVHVAAPGVYTFSTVPYALNQSGYGILEYMEGTSMAAPHVAGLAGLLFSYYDGVRNTFFNCWQVRNTIMRYVDVKPTLDGWTYTGGRINAYKALSSLLVPMNLTATTDTSSTKVSLNWEDKATGEGGYIVERSAGGEPFTAIYQLPSNVTSYEDSSVAATESYVYRIKAFNDFAESFPSNEVSVTVPRKRHGGGGGGCSIGAGKNSITALADLTVLLVPLIFIAVMRRRRSVKS